MSRKISSFIRSVKRSFRPPSPSEELAQLRRRNAALVKENMDLSGYIAFLTGKCIGFEVARLVRQAERGELVV
jgi:hypothetical protein